MSAAGVAALGVYTMGQALSRSNGTPILLAQSSNLPPVTVDAPTPRVAPRAAPVRRSAPRRGTVARRAPVPERVEVIPVANRPGGFNSTSQLGPPPPAYAGGQVATGGKVGLLGNRNVFDTPFSVTNYTSQYVQDTQANSIGDIVNSDASIKSMAPRGTHYDQISIRGFHLFNGEFLFDGLYGILPDQAYTAEFAERIEIFKGPNAFLNGVSLSGNIAGAVNVVPKRATDDPITRITGSFASQSLFGTHIDYGRRFGERNEWGIRANAVFKDGNSVVRDQEHRVGAATVATDYRGNRFRASIDIGYQNQRDIHVGTFVNVSPALTTVPAAPRGDRNISAPWSFVTNENIYGVARAEYDLANNLTLFGAVGGTKNKYVGLRDSPTLTSLSGAFTASSSFLDTRQSDLSSEAGIRAKFATGPIDHKLVIVGSYIDQTVNTPLFFLPASYFGNLYANNNPPQPFIGGANLGSNSGTQLSSVAFADTLYALGDRVQLTLGGRQQRIEGQSFSLAGVQTADYDKSKLTPSVGLIVKPIENLSLYANYIEAFTRGPVAPVGTINANEIFPPILSTSKEVGAKYDFGRIGMTLGLFEITQPQAITTVLAPGVSRFGLDGLQRNRGIEYTLFGEIIPGLRALGGLTLIDGKLLRTAAGGLNDGKTAVGVPDTSFVLGLDADVPGVSGLALNGRVIYASSQFLTANNVLKIPDWTRFDLGARYAFMWDKTRMTARFNVENVADNAYWATATRGFLSRGAPRTFLVSLTADLTPTAIAPALRPLWVK